LSVQNVKKRTKKMLGITALIAKTPEPNSPKRLMEKIFSSSSNPGKEWAMYTGDAYANFASKDSPPPKSNTDTSQNILPGHQCPSCLHDIASHYSMVGIRMDCIICGCDKTIKTIPNKYSFKSPIGLYAGRPHSDPSPSYKKRRATGIDRNAIRMCPPGTHWRWPEAKIPNKTS
jgi:hypothetical protein